MNQKREHEKALFASFLNVAPDFAGERLTEWHQPEDEREFPDIRGVSVTGRKIGVEIGEWLNEEEIQAAKQKEKVEEGILNVIGNQGQNPTKHMHYVWLRPKPNARISSADEARFREQLFACVRECDTRWPTERFWQGGHQLSGDELAPYPVLGKYLNAIKLWPADDGQWKENWITFPMRVYLFDRETMLGPLRKLVADKIGHYGSARTGFDVLSLLVVYNRAAIYNSPAESPLHSFDSAATELKAFIGANRGPFDRIFIYIALTPGARVLEV